MKDRSVLADAVKLTFSYLDRMVGVSALEKDRIDVFLRGFLPLVFAITPNEFALDFTSLPEDEETQDGASEAGGSIIDDSTDSSSMPATHRRGFGHKRTGADLRKKALKNAGGPADRAGSRTGGRKSKVSSPAPISRATSPVGSVVDSDVVMGEGDSPAPPEMMEMEIGSSTDLDATPVPADGAHRMETPILASPTPEPNSEAGSSTSMSAAPSKTETPAPISVPIPSLPTASNFFGADMVLPDLPELIHPFSDQPITVEARRQWNFFANTNYYGVLRVFQVSRFSLRFELNTDSSILGCLLSTLYHQEISSCSRKTTKRTRSAT